MYTYAHTHTYTHTHTHTCMHACMYIYIHTYIHTHIHTYTHSYTHTHTCIRTYIITNGRPHDPQGDLCRHTHTHTHTHIHTLTVQVITKEVPVEVEKVEYREVQVPVDRIVDKVYIHSNIHARTHVMFVLKKNQKKKVSRVPHVAPTTCSLTHLSM